MWCLPQLEFCGQLLQWALVKLIRNPPKAKATYTFTMSTHEQEYTDAIRNKLEEIDEFEDFPVDNWPDSDTIKGTAAAIAGANGKKASLWQEDWNDVEVDDDFAKNLKTELETIRAQQQQQQQQQ